jgi:hypothetical protein
MGVHVSLRAPKKKNHKYWIAAFVVVGVAGVALTGWIAARAGQAQDAATRQITGLEQKLAHVHIRPTIGAYSVDDPTRVSGGWKPFMAGSEASFRVYYTNSSDTSSAQDVGPNGKLLITESKPDLGQEFNNIRQQFIPSIHGPNWKGEELSAGDTKFFNAKSRVLSSQDGPKVWARTEGVFLIAVIRFTDSTGQYEQDICDWLQPHTLDVWHGCGQSYEKEIKLQ